MDRIGAYTWQPATDRWVWDPAMYRLHGYAPDVTTPTRPLFLAHRHPGDRERMREALSAAAVYGRPFACSHRILTEDRVVRPAVALGGAVATTDRGAGHGPLVRGYVVDVSPPAYRRPVGYDADDGLVRAVALMHEGLELSRDAAGDLLRWLARSHGIPLHALVSRLLELPRSAPAMGRADVGSLIGVLVPGCRALP